MHIIIPDQLTGEYKIVLASSSQDKKKLFALMSLIPKGYGRMNHALFFHIEHNNSVVSSTDDINLAIKIYNKISNSQIAHKALNIKTKQYLCLSCDHREKCNRYLRNQETIITDCNAYENT